MENAEERHVCDLDGNGGAQWNLLIIGVPQDSKFRVRFLHRDHHRRVVLTRPTVVDGHVHCIR